MAINIIIIVTINFNNIFPQSLRLKCVNKLFYKDCLVCIKFLAQLLKKVFFTKNSGSLTKNNGKRAVLIWKCRKLKC